jgi:hypothetical protein
MWKKYSRDGQGIYDNMTHANFKLDTYGYKQTRRIRNTYSFCTATTTRITFYVYYPAFVIYTQTVLLLGWL